MYGNHSVNNIIIVIIISVPVASCAADAIAQGQQNVAHIQSLHDLNAQRTRHRGMKRIGHKLVRGGILTEEGMKG